MFPLKRSALRFLPIVPLLMVFCVLPAIAQEPAVAEPRVGILKVRPRQVNFRKLNLAKRSVRSRYIWVTNKGKSDLHVSFGSASLPFKIACSCQEVTIPPRKSARAIVAFEPDQAGLYSDVFTINSDGANGRSSYTLVLKGSAFGEPPSSSASLSGVVVARQHPIADATVNLYGMGDDLDGSDTNLIATTATDSDGTFRFGRVYCANPATQVCRGVLGRYCRGMFLT